MNIGQTVNSASNKVTGFPKLAEEEPTSREATCKRTRNESNNTLTKVLSRMRLF